MLKKLSLAILGLSATGFAVAGTMGPVCEPGNVTVACEATAWEFGAQALYLGSLYSSQTILGTIVEVPFPEITPVPPVPLSKQTRVASLPIIVPTNPLLGQFNNQWNWGFMLEGAYHFNTGNDLKVTWINYSNNNINYWDDTVLAFRGIDPYGEVAESFTKISSDTFNQVNVELGQLANFGLVKQMRFYGGLQYAQIKTNAETCFAFSVPTFENHPNLLQPQIPTGHFTYLGGTFSTANFQGVGPVAGIDYAYHFTDAFSITANGSGSILYGTNHYSAGVLDPTGQVVLFGFNTSTNNMVPSLEAQLGVNYAYAMSQGVVNVQAGYLAVNYFNALQTQLIGQGGFLSSSDYGLYGPYVGLSYVGNV